MSEAQNLPIEAPRVAIVGRPNVGKSTLFNSLLGRRYAITDRSPGITRDPLSVSCLLGGERQITLVDTGGYLEDSKSGEMTQMVSSRSLREIDRASLVLLVLELSGPTGEDHDLLEIIRSTYRGPLLLVINKVDTPEKEPEAWEFCRLGMGTPIAVSAAHGRRLSELEREIVNLLPQKTQEAVPQREPLLRLAIIGKPNVGKSTLTNHLTKSETSLVSSQPGTTRDIVAARFSCRGVEFELFDTAGIRRRKSIKERQECYSVNRAISVMDEVDVVFFLLDATEGVSAQDKKIVQQITKRCRGIVFVANKWDLCEEQKFGSFAERFRFLFPSLAFAPIIPLTASTGEGVPLLMRTVLSVWKQLNRRAQTSKLNQALREWTSFRTPPREKTKTYKMRYLTQISSNPVRFCLVVNRVDGFPSSYLSYLKNQIRREFGYTLIPFSLELRQRT